MPLLLLIAQSGVAQINYMADMVSGKKKPIRWGIMAGLNATNFSLKGTKFEVEDKPGWQVGMMASISLGKRWTLDPQFLYVRQTLDLKHVDRREKGDLTCSSIDIPIGVGYKVLGPLRLFAGPVFTIMDESEVDFSPSRVDVAGLRTTLSYLMGAEVRLFDHLRVDVRYNGQFKKKKNVMISDGGGGSGQARTQFFSLNVGYYF